MTQVIEKARKRLIELEAEADKLRTFLGVYADLTGHEPVDSVDIGDEAAAIDPATATPAEIVAGAKMLMRKHARPLSRSKIVNLLMREGFILPGKDKSKNVGTVIWRSKQFEQVAGHGYWPREFGRWIGQAVRQPDMLES